MNPLREMRPRLREHAALALYGRLSTESDFLQPIHHEAAGNAVIRDAVASGRPFFVTRLSAIELATTVYWQRWRKRRTVRLPYLAHQKRLMGNLAGFFPTTGTSLDRFSEMLIEACTQADVMAISFHRDEHVIVNACCPGARLVQIDAFHSMCYEEPWSSQLAEKTVLVVPPFARSIESQYRERRRQLYRDPAVLPEFELKTLVPVQSSAGCATTYASWFDALERTLEAISGQEFDVALVGAGAYGMPIGAFVKGMGRGAVHMGGAT
ncbi:MAG TPA: hypothetical protein VFH17_03695, partial [Coriobacteriia bacterium]|nr:hypothetical protein [Coriobacteriia bacterium]